MAHCCRRNFLWKSCGKGPKRGIDRAQKLCRYFQTNGQGWILDDSNALRDILIHEFLHCFRLMTVIEVDIASGRTYRGDTGSDPLDAAQDDTRLARPSDWFIGETDETIFRHGNAERWEPAVANALKRVINVLPVRFPDLSYSMRSIASPGDVGRHIDKLRHAGQALPPI